MHYESTLTSEQLLAEKVSLITDIDKAIYFVDDTHIIVEQFDYLYDLSVHDLVYILDNYLQLVKWHMTVRMTH